VKEPAKKRAAKPRAETETLSFGEHSVDVTHPDRVLFPADGITKRDLVAYYGRVAPFLLPQIEDRPLTLQRWPEGIDGFSFFEKRAPKGMPDWIATTKQPSESAKGGTGDVAYPVIRSATGPASLAWFANLSTITFHIWMSRVGSIAAPDFLLFDLDPADTCPIRTLAHVALTLRDELAGVGLEVIVKTTGGKGLHLVAPLAPGYSYETGRRMNELVAGRMAALLPAEVTLERSKAKRTPNSVYFDWAQLGLGRTVVPPYTVRARPKGPVSTPIGWDEVAALSRSRSAGPTSETFSAWNLGNVPAHLAETGDLWAKGMRQGQKLEPALEKASSRWG
jgi:bifunctional non-homologous end joining protein LigD